MLLTCHCSQSSVSLERLVGGPRAGALATSISFLLFLYCLVTLLVLCLHLLVICFQKSRPFFPVTMFAILRIVSPILHAKLVTDCFFFILASLFFFFSFFLFFRLSQKLPKVETVPQKLVTSAKKKKKKKKVNKFDRYPRNCGGHRMCASFLIKGQHFE